MLGQKLDINQLSTRLFYSEKGTLIVSILFGLALALVFQKVCKDRKCLVITAPHTADVANKVFNFEGECFKYTPYGVKCPANEEIVKSV